MKRRKMIALSITSLLLIACSTNTQNTSSESTTTIEGVIKIDGSSTVYPITEAIAEEYRAVQPKVKVTVGISGTGGGFKKFYRGDIDINDASRPIKESEEKKCTENDITSVELSVAYDGLAVLKNPANNWLTSITVDELHKLWVPGAQDKLMYWNQIREEWPEEEIHLFGPGVASGTYDYFAEVICGKKVGTRGDYTASEDDNVLVQGIATDKYALGFFGLAYYEENKDKLALVAVDNGNGGVYPTMETVSSGEYAPLSRPIFIYVSNKATAKAEVVNFVNFYLESAASIAKEVGYVALPKEMYEAEKNKFRAFIKH
jgi:phosphate transport system substrate-binding protein